MCANLKWSAQGAKKLLWLKLSASDGLDNLDIRVHDKELAIKLRSHGLNDVIFKIMGKDQNVVNLVGIKVLPRYHLDASSGHVFTLFERGVINDVIYDRMVNTTRVEKYATLSCRTETSDLFALGNQLC